CGRDLADGVVEGIGHIDIARAVSGNAERGIKARRGSDAIDVTRAPQIPGKERKGGCWTPTLAPASSARRKEKRERDQTDAENSPHQYARCVPRVLTAEALIRKPNSGAQKNACHCRKTSVAFCALFWGMPLFLRAPRRNCVNWNGTYSHTAL